MNRWCSNVIYCLAIAAVFVFAGCEQKYQQQLLVHEPWIDPNFVIPEYASRSIDATGGIQAWAEAKELQFDCVVTFYKPDRSFYLTEHNYQIHPWLNYIRVVDIESQSQFVWQLSEENFSVSKNGERVDIDKKPVGSRSRDFAEMILAITTAPVRFLDESVEFTTNYEPVKIEGLWYYPINRTYRIEHACCEDSGQVFKRLEPLWSKVVFYQNKDSLLVDMLWFADIRGEKFLAVRGYDYHKLKGKDILVPGKVEIFRTDAKGVLQELLVRVDF